MGSSRGPCSSPRAWGCGWNVVRLLCFAFINWGAAENTAAVIVVNQTPPSIRAMEGSEFTIECTFNTSINSIKWFAEWNKTRHNVTAKVNNGTDRIILSADKEKRSLSLTVKKADVTDSGTYVCWVGSKDVIYPGNGTQVTINGQPKAPVKCKKLCTEFSRKEIPQKLLKTYRKTEPSCPKAAIIFVTKKNREFCADPEENWVKEAVRQLNQASAPLNPPLSSTVTSAVVQEGAGVFHRVVGNAGSKRLLAHVACTPIEIPKLMVNQTPANIQESEGSDLTMECRFTELKNHRTLDVKWYKHNGTGGTKKELMSERGGGSATLDLEKGFASFTLKNVNVTDTGTYVCEVGSTAWNWSASGAGTQVTITLVDLLVTQSPAFVKEEEGKQLTIECRFKALEKPSAKYSVKWYKNGTDGHEKELKNRTGSVMTILDFSAGLASLNLTKASMNDSGFYRCDFGKNGRGNGTRVTIHAVDLLVNQTPAAMNGSEGDKLTIECRFKVVKDSSTTSSVTWYKTGADGHKKELKNRTGIVTTALDSSKGLASLTFIKINRNDSGLYRCDFGKNGGGNGTRVTIHAHDQKLMSSYIVPGAVAGTLLFLLVLGILLWRCRQCSKEPLQSRSEAEINQLEMSSPPPADEVTYVDLNFHKRDAKAEEEVVYTEVKIRPKQRDDNDIYAKVKSHQR